MVNQDDPEVRIAELERRLAEPKHIAAPERLVEGSAVTPEDVRNAAFSKSVRGKPGYNEDEVDGYLARIEATLREPAARGAITAADIRNVTFSKPPIGRRGYNVDEVDAFLGRVEIELARRTGQQSAVDPGQDAPSDFGHSDDSRPQKILGHILAFRNETREGGGPWTWRAPLLFGSLLVAFACLPPINPIFLVIGVICLVWAALAWRFGWEF